MPAPYWKQSDGQLTVAVYDRGGGRAGYLVRARFASNPGTSESHAGLDGAIKAAQAVWAAYASGALDEPEAAPETWQQAVDKFLARPGKQPKTRASYERALSLFGRQIHKDRRVGSLTKRDVQGWLDSMDCKPISRQSYLRTLRACLRWCVEQGWCKADVTEGIRVEGVQHHVRPWLDPSEWDAFLRSFTPELRVRFGFALETGLRREELLQARWSWLHTTVGRKAIRVAPDEYFTPKWGTSRAIPLSAKAQAYLEEARQLWRGGTFLFQHDDDLLHDPKWARDVGRGCERAKVTRTDLHGLRRSCGARWLHDGMQLHLVSRLLGHRDVSTTMRHYGGIADGTLAAAIAAIDEKAGPVQGAQEQGEGAKVLPLKRKIGSGAG